MSQKRHLIIAGPILRRLTPNQMVIWLVSSQPLQGSFTCYQKNEDTPFLEEALSDANYTTFQVGSHAFVSLIDIAPSTPLSVNVLLEYDLRLETDTGKENLATLIPTLLYPGEKRPSFVVKTQLDRIVHGSCRKPHYSGKDALPRVDEKLKEQIHTPEARPALLLMTGDQIYADDVAGPMLWATHQVIETLGLNPEAFQGASIANSEALLKSNFCYYEREKILPHDYANRGVSDVFFRGSRKPIFTSVESHNHLITLAEVFAMYFLTWSPTLWSGIDLHPEPIPDVHRRLYFEELEAIEGFVTGLSQVQRLLAHVPVYMIFDDHDVTDDWNLTRGWEETAYGHSLARRILGNALVGYWFCQAWGNAPQDFKGDVMEAVTHYCESPDMTAQDHLIDQLFSFQKWHFTLETSPKLIVLDTRTQRWWSEKTPAQPSGLMDWEALTELQLELFGEEAVVLVSPAPVFGVKLIEAVQQIFSYFGQALIVDAENWMAHPGAANVILNIFKHPKTPQNFVILSGDVHYSLVYDVKIRFRKNSPNIWQITCSGFKNEFPHTLLRWFERLNRWIYYTRSPLNWFTKRRSMAIRARTPEGLSPQQLINKNGAGWLELDEQGVPQKISLLAAEGREYQFLSKKSHLLDMDE